jgi:hypothetical protein
MASVMLLPQLASVFDPWQVTITMELGTRNVGWVNFGSLKRVQTVKIDRSHLIADQSFFFTHCQDLVRGEA